MTHYDQLGRVRLVRRSDGAPLSGTSETDGIKVQSVRRVASGGNIEIVSNPYRTGAENTMGWTCTQQDRNGRVRWMGSFAGPVAPNSCLDAANRTGLAETRYQGDVTVSIDPANKQRDLARDALGRLVAVTEYTGGTPATYLTTYAYNALDNLVVVQQGSQSRSFVYSSLGRLVSAYNPESGGVSYTYFDHGGLHIRTDARSVTTTHSYDGLHRLRTKSYTDGTPGVTNEYYLAGYSPQVGRLKSVTSSVGSTVYTYDALGRVTASTQTVTGSPHSYGFLYTWLLNDGLASMRYPSGRTITYTQDDAGRVVQVQDGSKLYAQGIGYTPHGAITQMQLGNGLVEQWLYNSLLQPASIRLGDVAGSDSAFGAALDYGATNNNGNLLSQRITGMGLDRTQTYQYDGVNRLIGSGELAVWSRNFAYDQQGNGWVSSASGLSTSSFTPVTSNWFNAQNRLTGMGATYDGAGNQTAIGGFASTYDAENRLKTSTINNYTTTYFYDGEGRRVKKLLASGEQTLFIYDAMGQLAAEYTTGQSAHSGTRYLTVDHLGSIRAVTSQEKTVLARRDYLPFGEEIPPPLGGRTSVWAADAGLLQKFTGKARDPETGLDYFEARYLSAAQGRFTSVDPDQNLGLHLTDPQGWNGYAYARNNPLKYVDPDGRDYRVCQVDSDGKEYNCGNVTDDRAFEKYAKAQGWKIRGGNLVDQSGKTVGTARWFDGDSMRALIRGTQMAEPGVNLAGQGLMVFGLLVAPVPMAITQCAVGNCDTGGVAMAVIPELGGVLAGARLARAARGLSAAGIYEKAGGFAQATQDFAALKGVEKTIGAVKVKELSDGSKAVLRNFSRDSRPTLEIQHASGEVTKVRYN